MSIGGSTEELSGYFRRELGLAEFVAFGLLVVQAIVIVGYVAAAIANQVQLGGQDFGGEASHVWGYTLSLASNWSAPWAVALFLLGPLALAAWIGRRQGEEASVARIAWVVRLELVLSVLTIIGGILSIVGRVLQVSPPQNWSAFFAALGTGVGAICLGVLAMVVAKRLADDMRIDLWGHEDVSDLTKAHEEW